MLKAEATRLLGSIVAAGWQPGARARIAVWLPSPELWSRSHLVQIRDLSGT